mmetsp:Transcript_1939/g.5811  ORF Transcript_1939/g.5811 Transcript_1939/m.5811 type:complete len:239 (+) Transcript_1939:1815-2531(+)
MRYLAQHELFRRAQTVVPALLLEDAGEEEDVEPQAVPGEVLAEALLLSGEAARVEAVPVHATDEAGVEEEGGLDGPRLPERLVQVDDERSEDKVEDQHHHQPVERRDSQEDPNFRLVLAEDASALLHVRVACQHSLPCCCLARPLRQLQAGSRGLSAVAGAAVQGRRRAGRRPDKRPQHSPKVSPLQPQQDGDEGAETGGSSEVGAEVVGARGGRGDGKAEGASKEEEEEGAEERADG